MITALTATQLNPRVWRLAWTSDAVAPSYRVYRDGLLIGRPAANELVVSLAPGESPTFEVLDDDGDDPSPVYPASITLTWQAVSGAAWYRIDQSVSAAWVERARVVDDSRGTFSWVSGRLADGQTHSFRVVPIAEGGQEGTATTFAGLIVRIPDVPAVVMAYDDGDGTVEISAE